MAFTFNLRQERQDGCAAIRFASRHRDSGARNYMKIGMKRLLFLILAVLPFCVLAAPARTKPQPPDKWQLKFTENFSGKELNPKLWKRIEGNPNGGADWQKNISTREDLVELAGDFIILKGVRNQDPASDSRRVLCGGISTRGLFSMKYGKVEIRAKLEGQKGAWPAIWMMPDKSPNGWPNDGEIDILERLNHDGFVYQTVHSAWTQSNPQDPPKMGKAAIKPDAWNTYALEWTPEKIVWRVNGKATHSYAKIGDSRERWPWDAPFYLIIDMQLGGKWVGEVDETTLPVAMKVDWVKFYSLARGSKRISEFARPASRAN